MRYFVIKPPKGSVVGILIAAVILASSCEKQHDEKIACDRAISEKWDSAFADASRVFQIGETKTLVFENPYDAKQCIIVGGGSFIEETDAIYKAYVDNGIQAIVAEKLMRENMGEGLRIFFLKNDVILNSINLKNVRSCNSIDYMEIGEQVTFSIQLVPQLTEWIKDPNFSKHPEIGQDYLTNPDRPKPIEILSVR